MITLQRDAPVEGGCTGLLQFEKLPGVNQEGFQWTDCEVGDAINLIYQNIHKLDSFLSDLVRASTIFYALLRICTLSDLLE